MNFSIRKKRRRNARAERGASMTEYMIGIAILVAVFVLARVYLMGSAQTRGDAAQAVRDQMVPCGTGNLSGEQCL